MKRTPVLPPDLAGVIAVPPLPRNADSRRSLNLDEAGRLVRHIAAGGITRFMFGGNAFFYHLPLREYRQALEWMTGLPDPWWVLPSAGPGYGRLMDQAEILRPMGFPSVMLLPCSDPRDVAGLERGIREFADAAATPVVIYLKGEDTFGGDRDGGLEALWRLCRDGVCVGIKYAVVRPDPSVDPYLEGLLGHVDRSLVASGIGERPAVVHMRDWKLSGFTTGSGCVAPSLSQRIFEACASGCWDEAETLRARFLPLEDCRDAWNPAKVLHHAVALSGVAQTGPVAPFLSGLEPEKLERIRAALAALARGAGPGATASRAAARGVVGGVSPFAGGPEFEERRP